MINNQDELIINKCLIIDDEFEEVKDIIFELNRHSISTDYREDVLKKNVIIDPSIQLVVLDLYMSESQDSFDEALQSVAFLNEHIKGPFFLLIWTKHKDKFIEFTEKLSENYSNYENFPLEIKNIMHKKIRGQTDSSTIKKTVKDIIDFINSISDNYKNIYYYMKLTKIFQNKSTMFWNFFRNDNLKNKKTSKEFSEYYEKILGQAFNTFDKYFNYEKSGKGFLNIHAKFLEQELTINRIDYESGNNELEDRFKQEINSKLLVHNFNKFMPEEGLPGLIYKESKELKNNELLEDFINIVSLGERTLSPFESIKYIFFKLNELLGKGKKNIENLENVLQTVDKKTNEKILTMFKNIGEEKRIESKLKVNEELEDIIKSKIKSGILVITPYCDFAQKKRRMYYICQYWLLKMNLAIELHYLSLM